MKRDILWATTVLVVLVIQGVGHSGGKPVEQDGPLRDERYCADANGDGSLNVSDAVTILQYLFRGTATPHCIAQGEGLESPTREEFDKLRGVVESLKDQVGSRLRAYGGSYQGDDSNDRIIETGIEGEIVSLWISYTTEERISYSRPIRVSLGMHPLLSAAGRGDFIYGTEIDGTTFTVHHVIRDPGGGATAGHNEAELEYHWFALARDKSE